MKSYSMTCDVCELTYVRTAPFDSFWVSLIFPGYQRHFDICDDCSRQAKEETTFKKLWNKCFPKKETK